MGNHVQREHGGTGLHVLWELRPDRAVVWNELMLPTRPNFYPYGRELRRWMLGQDWTIPVFPADEAPFTNPYTEDASVLVAAYMRVTNDGAAWTDERGEINWVSAELRRVRLYSEFVLYTVRVCEALTKQLLFCSDLDPKSYRRDSMGQMLVKDCKACRKKKDPHSVSLLGSLAHRYGRCGAYDNCLDRDLRLLTSLRNQLVAHSETWQLRRVKVATARKDLRQESLATGETLLHMLLHIGEIETAMWEEVSLHIRSGTPVELHGPFVP